MKKLLFLVVIIALFAFLSGCGKIGSSPTPTAQGKGSLIIKVFLPDLKLKTIEPSLEDVTITAFDISGTGPNGTNFQKNNIPTGTSVTINALAVGEWTIVMDAKNASGSVIASGIAPNVFVASGITNSVEIELKQATGTGELNVSLSWPSGTIAYPSVTGTLTRVGDETVSNIIFTQAGNSATYQDNALPAGYYILSVDLKDGSILMWKEIETVRIVAGQTSNGSFNLTNNPEQIGDIQLIVNPRLLDPISINFNGQQEFLQEGTNMTVTATTNEDPVDSCQWYLNGKLLNGETGGSISIGSSLSVGSYRLTLVVVKGDIAGSKTLTFQVESSGNIAYHHGPIEPDYMPRIPGALVANWHTNSWEYSQESCWNFNAWMDFTIIPDVTDLKNITGSCTFRNMDLTYETGTNLDDDPHYTVKMTLRSGGALRALFFCNNDKSRWRHITFYDGNFDGEIRETRYVNNGTYAHIVLLKYRSPIIFANEIVEVWHFSDEEWVKSIRVYRDGLGPDTVLNFGADVNLATGRHHSTAYINVSYRGPEMILGYFNDDNLVVAENMDNPDPTIYPSPQQARTVYQTQGITPEIIGNLFIDENLNSNFYQLYPNL